MLRKIFLDVNNIVVCMSEVGSREADVTFKNSVSHRFVEDDETTIKNGYKCEDKDDGFFSFIAPDPIIITNMNANGEVIPFSVEMKQARLALYNAGLLDDVVEAVASMDKPTQIEWEFSPTVERKSPLTLKINEVLKLTDNELDDLFIAASKIGV